MPGILRTLVLAAHVGTPLVATVACGGSSAAPPSSMMEDGGASDADVAEASVTVSARLELPRAPLTSVALYVVPNFPAPGDRSVLRAENGIHFALGDDYPKELTAVLPRSYFAGFGQLKGKMTFQRVEVPTEAASFVSATLVDAGVKIAVSREGQAKLVVHGSYAPTEQERGSGELMGLSSVPFELHMPVAATQVVGTQFVLPAGCAQPLNVATSSTVDLNVMLVGADGVPFQPNNMRLSRAVSMTVETDEPHAWVAPSEAQGLGALRFPDTSTRVTIRPQLGEPLAIRVVAAGEITGAKVDFSVAGQAGGWLGLSDGMRYEGSWHRSSNRIAPTISDVRAGADALCSPPNPAWFELVSDTPQQCDVRPVTSEGGVDGLVLPPSDVGLTAYVSADGACSLRLRAAGFRGGAGFEQRLSVTLSNVEQMIKVP